MDGSIFARSGLAWAMLVSLLCVAAGREVVENDDAGKPHLKYQVDGKNRKAGDYVELFPSGMVKVHGEYQADKKSGAWVTRTQDGTVQETAHYQNDLLEGKYQYNYPNGRPQMTVNYVNGEFGGPITAFDPAGTTLFSVKYPMTRAAVQKAVDAWGPKDRSEPKMASEPKLTAPYEAGGVSPESQAAALKYLQLYRLLSNLPTNLSIDPGLADKAQHGAVLLHDIKHLEHQPPRPSDMDAAFYKAGYAGTSTGNCASGLRDLFGEIDAYMDDSDKSNVERVGHRQWILTPGFQKTGFGYADGYSVLSVFDGAAHSNSGFTYIAYPGEGYYPKMMLHDDAAWSLSLNTEKCKLDRKNLSIKVTAVDDHFGVTDTATAEVVAVAMNPTGTWPCVIFRPNLKRTGAGKYVVQVTGIENQSKQPQPLSYLVDVVDIRPAGEVQKQNGPRRRFGRDD